LTGRGRNEDSSAGGFRGPPPPFDPPPLTAEVLRTHFRGIYERDAHIRLIHDSVRAFARTLKLARGHVLLKGKPGGATKAS
jgi:hypothetical protein